MHPRGASLARGASASARVPTAGAPGAAGGALTRLWRRTTAGWERPGDAANGAAELAAANSSQEELPAPLLDAFDTARARAEISFRQELSQAAAVSLHPDALERRYRALLRREARKAAQQVRLPWWALMLPPNVRVAAGRSDLAWLVGGSVRRGRRVVVEVFTKNCEPCKRQHLKHMAIAASWPDVDFVKLDHDLCPDWCEEMGGVESVPHFLLFQDGCSRAPAAAASRLEDLGTGLDVPLSVRALDPYRWCAEEAEAPEALAGHYIAILALINC